MTRLLVIGCGRLGLPYALDMAAAGHDVTGVRRNLPADPPSAIDWLSTDITNPDQVARLPRDSDLVTIILTPAARSQEGYESIYQRGLGLVLSHLKPGRSRLLFVSATSVYAQHRGEWVDEDSVTAPTTYNGKSLLAAERAVQDHGPDNAVVRFSGIYGPDRRRLLASLEKPMEIQESPPTYSNRIHQSDCVGSLSFLSQRMLAGESVPRVLCASDGDPAPKFEVLDWLARRAGLVAPVGITSADPAPEQNKRVSNRQLLALGYRLQYEHYRDGYSEMMGNTAK